MTKFKQVVLGVVAAAALGMPLVGGAVSTAHAATAREVTESPCGTDVPNFLCPR